MVSPLSDADGRLTDVGDKEPLSETRTLSVPLLNVTLAEGNHGRRVWQVGSQCTPGMLHQHCHTCVVLLNLQRQTRGT